MILLSTPNAQPTKAVRFSFCFYCNVVLLYTKGSVETTEIIQFYLSKINLLFFAKTAFAQQKSGDIFPLTKVKNNAILSINEQMFF